MPRAKYNEPLTMVTVKIPVSMKRKMESLFPGRMSEFIRAAIEEALIKYDEKARERLLRKREELLAELEEIEQKLKQLELPKVSDKEKIWLIENANHIVKAITGNNGAWRGELPPEEALKLVLNSFCERFGVSLPEAKRKLLAVFPELDEEVVS